MTKKYSEEQIKKLTDNRNIAKCSGKTISYNKNFKIKAVKQYDDEGKTGSYAISLD